MSRSEILFPSIAVSILLLLSSCNNVELSSSNSDNSTSNFPAKQIPPLTPSELRVLKLMGGRVLPNGDIAIGKVKVLRRSRELAFPAEACVTVGDLEVLICTERGRAYESLLKTAVDPYNVQLALLLLGGVNGSRLNLNSGTTPKQGTLLDIFIRLPDGTSFPVERWIKNKRTLKNKKRIGWVFVGSSFAGDKSCLATKEGNVVNTWSFGNTILDNPAQTGDSDDFFEAFTENIPEKITAVTVLMKLKRSD